MNLIELHDFPFLQVFLNIVRKKIVKINEEMIDDEELINFYKFEGLLSLLETIYQMIMSAEEE